MFDDLYISQNKPFCEAYMGKFPVIFLTLKGVEGINFEEARLSLAELIALNKEQNPALSVKLRFSLKNLSELLYKQYGQKTIVLIDEYDVPVFKESIFTGLNNFKILSITDIRFDEQF